MGKGVNIPTAINGIRKTKEAKRDEEPTSRAGPGTVRKQFIGLKLRKKPFWLQGGERVYEEMIKRKQTKDRDNSDFNDKRARKRKKQEVLRMFSLKTAVYGGPTISRQVSWSSTIITCRRKPSLGPVSRKSR